MMPTALAAAFPGGLLGLVVLFTGLAFVTFALGARRVAGFSVERARVIVLAFVALAVLALIVGVI